MKKIKIGIIGCGNISDIYFKNLTEVFQAVEVVGTSDLIMERAKEKNEKYGVPIFTTDELLNNPEIEIILNLSTPPFHFEICMEALKHNKHVYVEKPLSVTTEEGAKLIEFAKEKNLLIGCAPDTFMGAGIQTCANLIDTNWIGDVVAGNVCMACHGHESWHPDPEFYYKKGGGPLFDMGPYYLTALVAMLGPIKSVIGVDNITFSKRVITSEKKKGTIIEVEVPTHVTAILEFCQGAIINLTTSFDIWGTKSSNIEIHGSLGSLIVPDPNTFGGEIAIKKAYTNEWKSVPFSHSYEENSRGIGLVDMAYAIKSNRPHRASGDLAFHILDVMHSICKSSETGTKIQIKSSCKKPNLLPNNLIKGYLDN